jgi:hypothetical protein
MRDEGLKNSSQYPRCRILATLNASKAYADPRSYSEEKDGAMKTHQTI